MSKEIEEILNKIISAGFKAYIVGGYVRDFLLDKNDTIDIDIATSALPKDLKNIFSDDDIKISSYGSIKLNYGKYNFDITTFRKDIEYNQGQLIKLEYTNNLDEDIKRRDFTINSLYMDINGNIIDKLNAQKDITNKMIRVVGSVEEKFREDPTRILRALRFMVTLDFKIDNQILEYILLNKKNISFSPNILKEELNRMLISPNVIKYFTYFKNIQLLDILKIDYNNLKYVEDVSGMYAQLNIGIDLPFTKEEKAHIKAIQNIMHYGKIDYGILFKYDLYLCLVAGILLDIDKKDINELYLSMPIKSIKELQINGDEIQELLEIGPSKTIKNIINNLVFLILNKKIKNDNITLREYITNNRKQWLNEL